MKNILLCGRMGSGKTTVAKYLETEYNYMIISFANPLKQIATEHFGMKAKDRLLLQMIGKVGRAIDAHTWIDLLKKNIDAHEKENITWVIDDCRYINEFDSLSVYDYGFVPVFVDAWEQLRIMRLIESGQEVSRKYLNDISETELDDFARKLPFDEKYKHVQWYSLMNNSTLVDLYKRVDEVIKIING